MKVLSLNCQKGYQPGLGAFLKKTLDAETYDFLLLQEATGAALPYLQHKGYAALHPMNEEFGEQAHTAILYRTRFALLESTFYSFGRLHPLPQLKHPGFGLLLAEFNANGEKILAGSVHLHSHFLSHVRKRETELVREHVSAMRQPGILAVIGGDFNLVLPGEIWRTERMLAPDLVSATRHVKYTLDSRYTEPYPVFSNHVANLLGRLGVGIRFKTDHIYMDRETAGRGVKARTLPDRVSDHSPVEVVLSPRKEIYEGVVERGEQHGTALGFPTANIPLPNGIEGGVYAAEAELRGKRYRAAVYANARRGILEVYLLDFSGDAYGVRITVALEKKIREDRAFTNMEALARQIREDVEDVKSWFEQDPVGRVS